MTSLHSNPLTFMLKVNAPSKSGHGLADTRTLKVYQGLIVLISPYIIFNVKENSLFQFSPIALIRPYSPLQTSPYLIGKQLCYLSTVKILRLFNILMEQGIPYKDKEMFLINS